MPSPLPLFTVINRQKEVLLYQLAKIQLGKTAWMFGYRIHPITHVPQRHNGLDLPDEVLKKLYYQNALRVIPGLDASDFPK